MASLLPGDSEISLTKNMESTAPSRNSRLALWPALANKTRWERPCASSKPAPQKPYVIPLACNAASLCCHSILGTSLLSQSHHSLSPLKSRPLLTGLCILKTSYGVWQRVGVQYLLNWIKYVTYGCNVFSWVQNVTSTKEVSWISPDRLENQEPQSIKNLEWTMATAKRKRA